MLLKRTVFQTALEGVGKARGVRGIPWEWRGPEGTRIGPRGIDR